jgi:hypothetical protein
MHLRILVEATPKKAFASAVDWPGLARSGRDEAAALEALAARMTRYAPIAKAAGQPFEPEGAVLEVVERVPGDASTEFGVPSRVAEADREPLTRTEAERLTAIVAAAWKRFDAVAAAAPEELRKGPRGGGRDTSTIVAHINDADSAYAHILGRKHQPTDRAAIAAMRADVLDVLRQPSDGGPVAGRKWPPRYAARRIAWHALDHAWEIEDRTEPA